MNTIDAFVGHSFREQDQDFIGKILDYLSAIELAVPGFRWVNAKGARPEQISEKVLELIEGKNLFIAICNAHELALHETGFSAAMRVWKGEVERKTSDWVTQEIGLAIGRKMKVILLLEEGVRVPGGLQGDLEYIPFRRERVADAFPALLQMISRLRPQPSSAMANPPSSEEPSAPASSPAPEPKTPEPPPDGNTSLISDIIEAAFSGTLGDLTATLDAYRKSSPAPDEQDVDQMYVFGLDQLRYRGKGMALEVLRELRAKHPTSVPIAQSFAATLAQLGEVDSAVAAYLHASDIADSMASKAHLIAPAVSLLQEAKKTDAARALAIRLEALLDLTSPDAAPMVALIADAWLKLGEFERFCALSEFALELGPALQSERFALAYECAERELHFLAYVHYNTLVRANDDQAVAWNNLGVTADALKLPIRATVAFERAKELKSARAGANLAHRLITLGHLRLAQQLCDETLQESGLDERLTAAQARLQSAPDEEDKRALKIGDDARPLREFLRRWARGYLDAQDVPATLAWVADLPDGALSLALTTHGGTVEGTAVIVTTPKRAALSAFTFGRTLAKPETREYRVTGQLHQRAGKLTLERTDDGESKSVLGSLLTIGAALSYLVIVEADGSAVLASAPLSANTALTTCRRAEMRSPS